MQIDNVLTTVNGQKINVSDAIAYLKFSGSFRSAIYDLVKCHVIDIKCKEFKIEISETEITKKQEERRMMTGFDNPETFHNHLKMNGITFDLWKTFTLFDIKKDALKTKVVSDKEIKNYFNKHKEKFSFACLARIVCKSSNEIKEVQSCLREGQDFVNVARQYSIDSNTRYTGGYIGEVGKGILSPEIEKTVFSAKENTVTKPFQENSFWTIYKVFHINNGELNNSVSYWIHDQIFNEWLNNEVHSASA
ncbi:MAG: peptidylprolyl isomerase [Alphaproteobacteria bacterium]|nr:peptidylprolyl isomerase [Alphaproteobacteria bacterium]